MSLAIWSEILGSNLRMFESPFDAEPRDGRPEAHLMFSYSNAGMDNAS